MQWEVFDRFYNAHWLLTWYSCSYFTTQLREAGVEDPTFVGTMENDVNSMIFNVEQFDRAGVYFAERLIHNQEWRGRMEERFNTVAPVYWERCERVRKLSVSRMSDEEIASDLEQMFVLQKEIRILGVTMNGLILDGRDHLTNALRRALVESLGVVDNFDQAWALLSLPTILSLRQKKDLEIAKLAERSPALNHTEREEQLLEIYNRYCWLDYMYYGPETLLERFRQEYGEAMKDNRSLGLEQELEKRKHAQEALLVQLNTNERARYLVALAQHVLWQKGWRKDVEYHGFYSYEPLLREIAKRKALDDWKDLLYFLPDELLGCIRKNVPAVELARERRVYSVLVAQNDSIQILTGVKAREYIALLDIVGVSGLVSEVRGRCAVPGYVRGVIRCINTPSQMSKMKSGDILLSQATSPDLIAAMKMAGAIITNTGGLICHAAITSRELGIPCVVGTKIATEVFRDGDIVEVDATNGIVRKLDRL